MLAAGADSLRNVLGLRRGEHEHDVIWRFFQRLQQRIEGGVGNLVSFVENVNLEAVAGWPVASSFTELADLVDTTIGGGIDFNDVNGVSSADFRAGLADSAGFGNGMILGAAIESGSQNPGDGSLANPAVATENVAVSGSSLLDGILERPGDVLLSDDLRELLRTVFAG